MSDKIVARQGAIQDTGNPVFDATCNIVMSWPFINPDRYEDLHNVLLDLYNKEPKRVAAGNRPTAKSLSQMADEVGAR
jgi:hypothetical protein